MLVAALVDLMIVCFFCVFVEYLRHSIVFSVGYLCIGFVVYWDSIVLLNVYGYCVFDVCFYCVSECLWRVLYFGRMFVLCFLLGFDECLWRAQLALLHQVFIL